MPEAGGDVIQRLIDLMDELQLDQGAKARLLRMEVSEAAMYCFKAAVLRRCWKGADDPVWKDDEPIKVANGGGEPVEIVCPEVAARAPVRRIGRGLQVEAVDARLSFSQRWKDCTCGDDPVCESCKEVEADLMKASGRHLDAVHELLVAGPAGCICHVAVYDGYMGGTTHTAQCRRYNEARQLLLGAR